MTFLSTLASVFFTNYIIWLIISMLKLNHGKKIFVILISIFEPGAVIWILVEFIRAIVYYDLGGELGEIFYANISYFAYLFAILTAYAVTMVITLRGTRIVKSRRLKRFENEYNGKTTKSQLIVNIIIFSFGAALIGIAFAILVFAKGFNGYFLAFLIAGVLLTAFGIYVAIINAPKGDKREKVIEKKIKKDDILFFIKIEDTIVTYIYDNDNEKSFNEGLGKILDVYVLTDFGELRIANNKYSILGIMTTSFDYNLIKDISLKRDKRDYKDIINLLSRYKRVRIDADNELRVLSVKNI